jgi:hypothetical protein
MAQVMKGVAGRFEEMDAKLVAMQSLDADETELFERGADIGDKVSWLEVAMEAMIAAGQLTAGEQVYQPPPPYTEWVACESDE